MSHRYQSLPSIIKDLQGVHFSLRDMNATCYLLSHVVAYPSAALRLHGTLPSVSRRAVPVGFTRSNMTAIA